MASTVPKTEKARSGLSREFYWPARKAQAAMLAERTWARTWPLRGLTEIFLTATGAGLWQALPHGLRPAGFALFATGLATAVYHLGGIKKPTVAEALNRIDETTGLPHQPATTLNDGLAQGQSETAQALWNLHRDQVKKQIGTFRAGWPGSPMTIIDPRGFRAPLAILAIVFGTYGLCNDPIDRLAAAIDWQTPPPPVPTVRVDAWVAPPPYAVNQTPIFLSTAEHTDRTARIDSAVPAGSTLLIRIFNDRTAHLSIKGGAEEANNASDVKEAGMEEHLLNLNSNANIIIDGAAGTHMVWRFDVEPAMPPDIAITDNPAPEKGRPGALGMSVILKDKTPGAAITGMRIESAEPAAGKSRRPVRPEQFIPLR